MQAEALALGTRGGRRRRSGADGRAVAEGLVRLGDIVTVAFSGLLASRLRFPGDARPEAVTAALRTGTLLAGNVFALFKLYHIERLPQLAHQLPRLLGGWAVTIAAVLAALYGIKSSADLSRLWVAYWLLVGGAGFVAWRVLAKHAIRHAWKQGRLGRRLLLVGDGRLMADCL